MDLGESLDLYEDVEAVLSCDLRWGFSVEPVDCTGCSATFSIPEANVSYGMTISVADGDSGKVSSLALHLTPAQVTVLDAVAPMLAYRIFVTFPDTSVLTFGHGRVIITD